MDKRFRKEMEMMIADMLRFATPEERANLLGSADERKEQAEPPAKGRSGSQSAKMRKKPKVRVRL